MKTHHPKIFIGKIATYSTDEVHRILTAFSNAVDENDEQQIRRPVQRILPRPRSVDEIDKRPGKDRHRKNASQPCTHRLAKTRRYWRIVNKSHMSSQISQSSAFQERPRRFTESVIREMTREAMKYGAVNLGQGFPDFAAPEDIKQKAMEAIAADHNQYAITWGVKSFRDAIAKKTMWFLGLDIDPETEITVTAARPRG